MNARTLIETYIPEKDDSEEREERTAANDEEREATPKKCPHCMGGRVAVEGGRGYKCPDCRGGFIPRH